MRIHTRHPVELFAAVIIYYTSWGRDLRRTRCWVKWEQTVSSWQNIRQYTLGRETLDGVFILRLTNEEAQFNGKFKTKLLRSNFQYNVSGPVEGDAAVREKPKIRIIFWIFILVGNASNAHEWKVNLLWIVFGMLSILESVINYRTYSCLVLS